MTSDIALYIHWPFCVSKCPYCDFNSHVAEKVDQSRWTKALIREMDWFAQDVDSSRSLTSIFFGGGTPSLMAAETVAALIDAARQRWRPSDDLEVTLEANPSSVEAERFKAYRAAGVNRLSLGVQSFDDQALKFLERAHDSSMARKALAIAIETFPRFSFDLIYARPGQGEEDWRKELNEALSYAGSHLSVYQLTIEAGTRFAKDKVPAAEENLASRMFDMTADVLGDAGLGAYEISNHARPGHECRHNLTYWRGEDYIGVGPGAHGRLTTPGGTIATRQTPLPERWLGMVERDGHASADRSTLTEVERREEIVLMGLRLKDGIARDRFRRQTGQELEEAFEGDRLSRLIDGGFLILDPDGLRATDAGRLRLNAVIESLLA